MAKQNKVTYRAVTRLENLPSAIDCVLWNGHFYQMEDNTVMEAMSYWCCVNALRGKLREDALLQPSFVNIMGMLIDLGVGVWERRDE